MAKEQPMELEGVVIEALKDAFRVEISPDLRKLDLERGSEVFVIARLAGKMRQNNIRVVPGDKVRVEVSPYDLTKGRITFRMKG